MTTNELDAFNIYYLLIIAHDTSYFKWEDDNEKDLLFDNKIAALRQINPSYWY